MIPELIISPEAEVDIAEAFDWYDTQVHGLGSEFLLVLDALFNSILRNHLVYPIVYKMFTGRLLEDFLIQSSSYSKKQKLLFFLYFMLNAILAFGRRESKGSSNQRIQTDAAEPRC